MAFADEFGNDGGADPAGSAGDEYAHEKPHDVMSAAVITTIALMSVAVIN
jgi:hypothetical protein